MQKCSKTLTERLYYFVAYLICFLNRISHYYYFFLILHDNRMRLGMVCFGFLIMVIIILSLPLK